MNTTSDQVIAFRSQFQKRLDLGNEAAIASLMYALILVHQDATRTETPFLLNLIYHPIWGEYIYANPTLLQSVVKRVSRGRLVNPDALAIWGKIATLCQKVHDGAEVSDLQKAQCEYIEALTKPKIPQDGAQQQTIDAVVDFHELLDELIEKDNLVVPIQGTRQSYEFAASVLPGFSIALNWVADALGRNMADAVDILKHRLSQSDNGPNNLDGEPTSSSTGGKSNPHLLERTLLRKFVLDIWAQET